MASGLTRAIILKSMLACFISHLVRAGFWMALIRSTGLLAYVLLALATTRLRDPVS